jgi:PQQ enzyme repeat
MLPGQGAIVAIDAATGNELWKTYTVAESRPQGKNDAGTQLFGPSGASIWSSPTIDAKRRVLYAGTGENHSAPATSTSDAVLALPLNSGVIRWSRQLLAGDMGNGACLAWDKTNCLEPHGPDFDLGASTNLVTLADGKRLLTIGPKSGIVWALDPDDDGRIVWQTRIGNGGPLGGVQWGTVTDGRVVYAAVSVARINLVPGQPIVLDPRRRRIARACSRDRKGVVECAASESLRWPKGMQPRPIGRCHRHRGLRAFRFGRRSHARIRDLRRSDIVELRHGEALRHCERH